MDLNIVSSKKDGFAENSWYGLHWDLLEDTCHKLSEILSLELVQTYDFSRIYHKGDVLVKHDDRPSCEYSATINLRNNSCPWEFFWEGGSALMEQGDAVLYTGCNVTHWREENKADSTHQVFLHYVDANGPNADHANEYMKQRHTLTTWRE
jgi:hypothetical protein